MKRRPKKIVCIDYLLKEIEVSSVSFSDREKITIVNAMYKACRATANMHATDSRLGLWNKVSNATLIKRILKYPDKPRER